jgi:opacity protein-like surface antigen
MFNQRKLAYIFISMLPISAPSLADTVPWQGPYAGVYAGAGVATNHLSTNTGTVTDTSYFATEVGVNAINNAGTWHQATSRGIFGLQAGHNWIWKQMVYGVALDYGAMSMSSSHNTNNTYPDYSAQYAFSSSIETNWLFTLRGRVGYQKSLYLPSLLYVTGGMAMTDLKINNLFTDNFSLGGSGYNGTSQNLIGWTLGAGVEIMTLKHMSLNVEYLYVDIPSITTVGSIFNAQSGFGVPEHALTSPFSSTTNFYANIVRIGCNYQFDE